MGGGWGGVRGNFHTQSVKSFTLFFSILKASLNGNDLKENGIFLKRKKLTFKLFQHFRSENLRYCEDRLESGAAVPGRLLVNIRHRGVEGLYV